MKPTVPAAPKMPCAVDDAPERRVRGDDRVERRVEHREPGRLDEDQRDGQQRIRDPGVGQAHDRRQDRPDDDERERAAPVDEPAGERRQQQHRQPEHREGQPDQVETGPESLEEEAPDDLVGAAREVAAGVDDEDRDQAAVPEPGRAQRPDARVRRGRRRWRRRPAGWSMAPRAGTRSSRPTGPGCVRSPVSRPRSPIGMAASKRGDRHRTRRRTRSRRRARPRARRSPARAAARPSGPRRTARTPRRDGRAASHRSGSHGPPGRRRPSPARTRRAAGRTRAVP